MKINYITTKIEKEISGRLRYEGEIRKRLKDVELNMIEYSPSKTSLKGIAFAARAINKLLHFPYQVKTKAKKGNITHITSEDLAYLLNFTEFKRTIVSCHDLYNWIFCRNSPFWKLNIRGLKKADRIITVSNFSKSEIVKYLEYPEEKIRVINDAVDHSHYYLKRNKEILKKYNLPENEKIILYVGSEQPKHNLPFLVKSFYQLKKKMPRVKLLKIGNPQQTGARKKLLDLIKKLNLEKEVIFLGYVDEKKLPQWYNAADLSVYPCLYGGFGLPPLEAMACGTPIITSDLTSLPEVVGDAGIMIDPYNQNEMTEAMYKLLTNNKLRKSLIQKGLVRTKMFNWEKSAKETQMLYREVTTIDY
ncbi:glycosyltransferase family 4 protein [Patescibacteria group bacterium]|nr:glycosyltransferase family 4 protein [Patescibacteria group bacterium]